MKLNYLCVSIGTYFDHLHKGKHQVKDIVLYENDLGEPKYIKVEYDDGHYMVYYPKCFIVYSSGD